MVGQVIRFAGYRFSRLAR